MAASQRIGRLKKECQMFENSPPPGISCCFGGSADEDKIDQLEASIVGGSGTPYEKGIFKLTITIPERYPFEPPKVRFVTKIYHPNVDDGGRICLDVLKMPPNGTWKPILNLTAVLTSIQLLMAEPNPDDPLLMDVANEYKFDKDSFTRRATEYTQKYAMNNNSNGIQGASRPA